MAPENQNSENREPQLDLLLPKGTLDVPLWKSLFTGIDAALFPKKLPPLVLTSRPENPGELWGERLTRPWWQSIFSNLRDVVAPPKLPLVFLVLLPRAQPEGIREASPPQSSDLVGTDDPRIPVRADQIRPVCSLYVRIRCSATGPARLGNGFT